MPGAAIVAGGDAAEVFDFLEEAFDEKKQSASLGIAVERVTTDNGSCYRSKAFNNACAALRLRHIFTKPYTPRTNGKAERFIQPSRREWAYARAYENSEQSARELAAPLQFASTARRDKRMRPHRPIGLGSEQPLETPRLERYRLVWNHEGFPFVANRDSRWPLVRRPA